MSRDALLVGSVLAFLGLVVVPGLVLLVYLAVRRARLYTRALDAWAAGRGVQLSSTYPTPSFRTSLDGVAVRLSHPVRYRHHRNGRRREYHYHLEVQIPTHLGDLTVRRTGNFAHQLIDFVFQEQDIQLGDAAFDKAYVIQTSQPDAARGWLLGPRRDAMEQAQRELEGLELPAFVLARNGLQLAGKGHFPVEKLDPAIAVLSRLALMLAR